MDNYAIDTASRFGDIPFVDFTKELVTGVFDSLVEAHILQMEEYSNFVSSLTQNLTTYINNTQDGVTFDQISDFVSNYELPEVDVSDLTTYLNKLDAPSTSTSPGITGTNSTNAENTWWQGLINAVGPAISGLVDKIEDPNEIAGLQAWDKYNEKVLAGASIVAADVPNYSEIHQAIAALISSNKYSLLQTMAKQGIMRLVVTEGEIETKLTFSTWNNSASGSSASYKKRDKLRTKNKNKVAGGIIGLFRAKKKRKSVQRTVTVNTAKSYQRDSSGTRVNIFGRCLIKFKTDYAPLNG